MKKALLIIIFFVAPALFPQDIFKSNWGDSQKQVIENEKKDFSILQDSLIDLNSFSDGTIVRRTWYFNNDKLYSIIINVKYNDKYYATEAIKIYNETYGYPSFTYLPEKDTIFIFRWENRSDLELDVTVYLKQRLIRSTFKTKETALIPHNNSSIKYQDKNSIFESQLLPGEGDRNFVIKKEACLYEKPIKESRVISIIKKGENLKNLIDVRYKTIKATKCKVLKQIELNGTNYGKIKYLSNKNYYDGNNPGVSFKFKPGQILQFLQYRAEGDAIYKIGENIYSLGIEYNGDSEIIEEGETEIWIKVKLKNKLCGWLFVDEKSIITEY